MIHYKDIERDLEEFESMSRANIKGELSQTELDRFALRVLHVIAGEMDSLSFCARMIAESLKAGKKGGSRGANRHTRAASKRGPGRKAP